MGWVYCWKGKRRRISQINARDTGRATRVMRAPPLGPRRAARLDSSRAAQPAQMTSMADQSSSTSARKAGRSQGRVRAKVSQKARRRWMAQPRGSASRAKTAPKKIWVAAWCWESGRG